MPLVRSHEGIVGRYPVPHLGRISLVRLSADDVAAMIARLGCAHTGPHTHELAPTKTDRSRRTIYLPATAVAALREQRLRTGRWGRFVFATSTGTAMDARNVVRQYHDARQRLGLPNVPWHHLRHFATTALLEAGEDLFVVSRVLAHTPVATTANLYGHVQPAMLRRSADRMDELMTRAASNG